MQLNPDCVRAVLLEFESMDFYNSHTVTSLHGKLSDYSFDEVHYCCIKLIEGNYLIAEIPRSDYPCYPPRIEEMFAMTFSGHEYLSLIKSDNVWSDVKGVASKVGSYSMQTLVTIATDIISGKIKALF